MTVTIRQYEERDREQILALFKHVFGVGPERQLSKRWQWEFDRSPGRAVAGPRQWVAMQGDKLMVYMGSFPVRLKVLDREFVIYVECDFIADDEVRRSDPTLIVRFLRQFTQANAPLANAIAYSEPHAKLRKWLKHREVPMVPMYLMPLRTAPMLRFLAEGGRVPGFLAKGPAGWLVAQLSTLAVKAVNLFRAPKADPAIAVRRIEQADERFDALWARLKEQFPIVAVRDRAFVQWRFFEDPNFEHAVFGAFDAGGQLVGYGVARMGQWRGMRVGRVMDLFCDPDAAGTASSLLKSCVRHLRSGGADIATCMGLHPKLRRVVRRTFYLTQARYTLPALLLWLGAPELAEPIYDAANWHYSHADGDRDFSD